MEFLIVLLIIPLMYYFIVCHVYLSMILVLRAAMKKLRTWRIAEGKVISAECPGPAVLRNPTTIVYEFETESGEKQTGKAIFTKKTSLHGGENVMLLYNPKKPSFCKLEPELRAGMALERDVFCLKSEKKIRKELIICACSCLTCAVAAVIADRMISYTPGALIGGYLFTACLMMALGVLSMYKFLPERLDRIDAH